MAHDTILQIGEVGQPFSAWIGLESEIADLVAVVNNWPFSIWPGHPTTIAWLQWARFARDGEWF